MVRQATHRDPASTKSAPQRSGDSPLPSLIALVDRPQRSPFPKGAETRWRARSSAWVWASTKSAPQRNGDGGRAGTRTSGPRLNEVRSPKERRHALGHADLSSISRPQRSPLPKGAETRRPVHHHDTRRLRLNEVKPLVMV